MRHINVILAVGMLFANAGLLNAAEDEAIKEAMKQIEGTWQVVSREQDGMKAPEERLREAVKDRRKVIKDGAFKVFVGEKLAGEGTIKIVAVEQGVYKALVKITKGEYAGATVRWLIKPKGDTLTYCRLRRSKEWPTEFSSEGGVLKVEKRLKPSGSEN